MVGDKYCSECGDKLAHSTPQGLCPTCLLKTGQSGLSRIGQDNRPTEVMPTSCRCMTYEMLTGELPLGRFVPPSEKAHTDVRLDTVVLRALNKEPDQRYQQASDVKTEVEALSLSPPTVTAYEPYTEEALNRIQKRLKKPAVGLKVSGRINCITSLPLLLAWMAFAATEDRQDDHVP